MTLRHLKILVAVCQENSITKAAEKLYMSQPSVSIAVRELEKYYNQPIFERIYRKLHITPFGTELYQYAVRIVSLFDEMDIMASLHQFDNMVRIGCGTTVGQIMAPMIITGFRKRHPDADVTVIVDNEISALKQALLENRIDFAVVESVAEDPSMKVVFSITTPLAAVCHRDNPLARKAVVSAEDLCGESILARQKGSYTRSAMDSFFASKGLAVTPKWESVDGLALLNAVRQNMGVSFLALNHIRAVGDPDLVILQVEGFSAPYHYSIFTHRDKIMSPMMHSLAEYFVEQSGV